VLLLLQALRHASCALPDEAVAWQHQQSELVAQPAVDHALLLLLLLLVVPPQLQPG
jgi:hypothetical protein